MTWPSRNQWDPVSLFIRNPALDPHPVIAAHVTVVGCESDECVPGLPCLVESIEHTTDLRIQLFNIGVVTGAPLPIVIFRHHAPGSRFAAVHTGLAFEPVVEALWDRNRFRIVAIVVLLQREVR